MCAPWCPLIALRSSTAWPRPVAAWLCTPPQNSPGPGAEIAALIQKELWGQLAGPVERLGGAYAPIPFAAELEQALYPNQRTIADAIRKMG